jgi:site-specific DNA-methyltransferase (adenine-specific)
VQTVTLRLGDSFEILGEMEENSVWAVVCDPPYELAGGFMGKEWDTTGVAFSTRFWGRVFRVLKPGGVVKTFGGTRTFHRMAKAMEEAGFVGISMEPWLYSSGFPKSLDVSKQVDKKSGSKGKSGVKGNAKAWQGWGTALKPSWEPVVVARKPE